MTVRHRSYPTPRAKHWRRAVAVALLGVAITAAPSAHAQDARKILKSMSDYITGQQSALISFDADTEVVTSDMQKIQFTSSGQVALSRPDKVRITRTGGYADVELVFDGKTVALLGKNINMFAKAESPGSIDQLVDGIRDRYNISLPGADLLLSRVYDELTSEVIEAKHIGEGVIDGVYCEHLAFRSAEVDWQIWVEAGARPIPRKFVITSKHVAGAPQYTLRIKDWKTDVSISADTFVFKPPADAKQIDFSALNDIDEIPAGQILGGKK